MNKLGLSVFLILLTGSAVAQQSEEKPKPHAEITRFAETHKGQWTFAGRTEDTPYSTEHQWTGKMNARPILNGQALECTYVFHSEVAAGPVLGREVLWYDSSRNALAHHFIAEDGMVQRGFGMPNDRSRWEAICSKADVSYKIRGIADTFAPNEKSFIRQAKVLVEGDKWMPLFRAKFTRVKETPVCSRDEQEVLETAMGWGAARERKDIAHIDQLMADEWTGVKPDGTLVGKTEALALFKSPDFESRSNVYDLQAKVYGNTAVVKGLLNQDAQYMGSPFGGIIRLTETYVKHDGRWLCVASHGTPVSVTASGSSKPRPEHKKLGRLVGDWSYTGRIDSQWQDTEFGPAGTFSGKTSLHYILNGLFVEEQWSETNEAGKRASGIIIFGYDAQKGKHSSSFFTSDGVMQDWTYDIGDDTMTGRSSLTSEDGEAYLIKAFWQYTPNWDAFTSVWKLSADNGKTWKVWMKYKGAKIGKKDTASDTLESSSSMSDEQELTKLLSHWFEAVRKRDLAFFDRIIADDFTLMPPDPKATFITKDEYIGLIKSGDLEPTTTRIDTMDVKVLGNTALITSKWTVIKGRVRGDDISGPYCSTSTWIKRDGQWQCAASHDLRLEEDQATKNKAVLRRVYEVLNDGTLDMATLRPIYHKGFIFHGNGGYQTTGVRAFKDSIDQLKRLFPDYHEAEKETIAEGDFVASRWIATGTHSGNAKKFSMPNISMYRFKDGKIIEQWFLCDSESRKKQLGQDNIFGEE
jgi:ketosteroid isomerase-like protein/predicted ester cyclase